MNLLAFDTSTETMSIAVQRGDGPPGQASVQVFEHTGPGGAQASLHLIPAILRLLDEAGLATSDLDVIAFGRGPGSFTGLRTACSVAQGLAFGARGGVGVPVLPVDTLLAVAEEARWQRAQADPAAPPAVQVVAMLDARMGEIYASRYQYDCSENGSCLWTFDEGCSLFLPYKTSLGQLLGTVDGGDAGAASPVLTLAGNVFGVHGPALDDALAGAAALPRIAALPTATAMLRLAPQLLQAGLAVAAADALPLYIRDKVAQTTEERRLATEMQKAAAARA
jgi:tRNA threonylcarbamoyladenosine biosynthesis protein TsaB